MEKIIVGSTTIEVENWANNHRVIDLPAHPIAGVSPEVQDRNRQEAAVRRGAIFNSDASFKCEEWPFKKGDHFFTSVGKEYEVLGNEGTTYHANRVV